MDSKALDSMIKIAGHYIEKGVRDFDRFSREVVEALGEGAEPYLEEGWNRALAEDKIIKYQREIAAKKKTQARIVYSCLFLIAGLAVFANLLSIYLSWVYGELIDLKKLQTLLWVSLVMPSLVIIFIGAGLVIKGNLYHEERPKNRPKDKVEEDMMISIIESETGKVVGRYTTNLSGLNYTPSDEEYFAEAWQSAVDDKVVDADARDNYRFRLIR